MKRADYKATRELLTNTPVPQQTRSYKPVSHEQLIDLTLESIYAAGFELDKEVYTASTDGLVANGRFTISNVADRDMQLQIGWQNSYNRQVSLKFAIGARIFICQNGCVSGDYGSFKKKHIGEVQTFAPTAITDYIKSAGDAFRRLQEDRDVMKNIEVTATRKAELVGQLYIEKEIINSLQLNIIKSEIKKPTFDYGAKDSLWELYQHTTYALKQQHPGSWMNSHIDTHEFFVNEAGILVDKTIQPVFVNSDNQLHLFETV
jgi:hypothetical protein